MHTLMSSIVALIMVIGMVPVSVRAQDTGSIADPATPANQVINNEEELEPITLEDLAPVSLPGTVSCFDHYAFGSVQVELASQTGSVVAGTPVHFSGIVKNKNPYPVVNGRLFVKVFRTNSDEKNVYGPDLVDQFVALDNISVPAVGQIPVDISWEVPASASEGEYILATYFLTAERFNLLGLTFTDDVIGNKVSFGVVGEKTLGVMFDKTKVSVNGENYGFAMFPPLTSQSDPVAVEAVVKNPLSTPEEVTVTWEVYEWDAQMQQNLVASKQEQVSLEPRGEKKLALTVTDNQHSVYYVLGKLQWKDSHSIIGVRFARPDINKFQINFPSTIFYPLVQGQENILFSCFFNAGTDELVPGAALELEVRDLAGTVIHSHRYEGDISDAMLAVADTFTPSQTYTDFDVSARLYKDGSLVDEALHQYRCRSIDPTLCELYQDLNATQASSDTHDPWIMWSALTSGALLIIIGLIVVVKKWYRSRLVLSEETETL